MAGPLYGLRVIELAGIGPGPHASMLLGDLGALRLVAVGLGSSLADEHLDLAELVLEGTHLACKAVGEAAGALRSGVGGWLRLGVRHGQ